MRKIISTLLFVTLLSCVNCVMAQWSGSGTAADPYLIRSDMDLKRLSDSVNAGNSYLGNFFLQTADLDMNENFSEGFPMIGHYDINGLDEYVAICFSGTYDGGGHYINKLKVSGGEDAALFLGVINGAVKNLNILNANISGSLNLGGVATFIEESEISNVTVSANLYATSPSFDASGIAGASPSSSIRNCVTIINVVFYDSPSDATDIAYLNGICSYTHDGTVENCLVEFNIVNPLGYAYSFVPFAGDGVVSHCILTETNVKEVDYGSVGMAYSRCYLNHQNTGFVSYPAVGFLPNGLRVATTAQLTSGAFLNNSGWTETQGLYPRPAAVANTDVALLAASPIMLNEADCINSVANAFALNTSNDVVWETESNLVSINGSNATVTLRQNAEDVEIFAYRNDVMKTITLTTAGSSNGILGSPENPLTIDNENDLFNFANAVNRKSTYKGVSLESTSGKYFKLTSDIVLTRDWTPIGLYDDDNLNPYHSNFYGNFDGGNHKISNLVLPEGYDKEYFGLFGYIYDAYISDLEIQCNISAATYMDIAGLVANSYASVIYNCKVSGSIESAGQGSHLAGIVMDADASYVSGCLNEASITSLDQATCGGICAVASSSQIESCSNAGNINGGNRSLCAGIAGDCTDSNIVGCVNFGHIAEDLIGQNYAIASSFTVTSDYSGVVDGCAVYGDFVAPLVPSQGALHTRKLVKNCILGVNVIDDNNSLISSIFYDNYYDSLHNCYFDKQLYPYTSVPNLTGLNTTQMIGALPVGYTDMDADFWSFGEDRYPIPAGLRVDSDVATLALYPIRLASTGRTADEITRVSHNFYLPEIEGATWSVLESEYNVLEISGNTVIVTPDVINDVETGVVVTLNGVSRTYYMIVAHQSSETHGELEIATAEDYYEFVNVINSSNGGVYHGNEIGQYGLGSTFYIVNDIDLNTLPDTIVLPSIKIFNGTLNGQGHTISNVKLQPQETYETVTVDYKDFNVQGGLISKLYGTVDSLNITINDNINATHVGIAGIICAVAESNSMISNCSVNLNSEFTVTIGALICGKAEYSNILNCHTYGTGTVLSPADYGAGDLKVSGVVGICDQSTVVGCSNDVDVRVDGSDGYSRAAGIVASAYALTMENCINNATIISSGYVGGIVGQMGNQIDDSEMAIRYSVNNGHVEGKYAGGIIGYSEDPGSGRRAIVEIQNCLNTSQISGSNVAGGISGRFQHDACSILNCANYGSVSNTSTVNDMFNCTGGIVGSFVSAGIYLDTEVDISSNIVVSSINVAPSSDTSLFPFAIASACEENNFFDEQNSEVNVPTMRLNYASTGTPLTTNEMVGEALQDRLPSGWTFASNLYPLPEGIEETPHIRLSRIPIFLYSEGIGRNERPSDIITSILLPQVDGVTWSSESPILTVPADGGEVAIVHQQDATEVIITAEYNGETRDFVFNIHGLAGISADNPTHISNTEGFTTINNTNCGAFNLYYQLDSNIVIENESISSFQGTFDGNGNLIVANSMESGLFRKTNKARISNLMVLVNSVEIVDSASVFGGVADVAYDSKFINCAVNGIIKGVSSVGGIVGETYDGTEISGCGFSGTVFSMGAIGGIVGTAYNTVIRNCISGSVLDPSISFYLLDSPMSKSPDDMVGGDGSMDENIIYGAIAGVCDGLEVDTCLVVGQSYRNISSYPVVNSCENITVNTCIFDKQMWGADENVNENDNVIPLTTREIANENAFSDMSGWTVAPKRYPIPSGILTYMPAMLLAEPLFIGENDIDFNHVSALSVEEGGNVVWDMYDEESGSIEYDGGFNLDCVLNEEDTVTNFVVSSIQTELSESPFQMFRNVTNAKGIITYTLSSDVACEGSDFTISVETVGAYNYSWDLPDVLNECLVAGGNDTDSTVTLRLPSGLISDDSAWDPYDFNINLIVSVEGCDNPHRKTIDLDVSPSAMHYAISNFQSNVCVGDEINLVYELDAEYSANHTDVAENFHLEWYDAATDEPLSNTTRYYIPSIVESQDIRVIFVSSYLENLECRDTVNLSLNVVAGTEISVLSGTLDQQLCEGELMEPVVLSVVSPENNLPDGIYADYDSQANLLTLSGRPVDQRGNTYGNFTYNVSSCGFESNGSLSVTKRPRFYSGEFSQILTSGIPLDIYLSCADVSQSDVMNSIRWEGTDSETTPPSGVSVVPSDDYTTEIVGAPEPGEYMYYVTLPQTGNCPPATYSNYIGAYDEVNLTPTALDNSICLGESTTLSTSERPTDFDVHVDYSYAWMLSGSTDTLGVESRLEINPESVGTFTYDVTLEGKKTIGEIEVGDFIREIEINPGRYIAYKNFEMGLNGEIPEYVVMAIDGDSLVVMNTSPVHHNWSEVNDDIDGIQNCSTLPQALADMNGWANTAAMQENGNDSNVASLVQSDNPNLYVPSVGELNYILLNYNKLYFIFNNDDEGNILSSTEKDDSTVYAISVAHMAFVKAAKTADDGLVYMFNKIPISVVTELSGRSVDLSKSGSVSVVVADHQTVSVSSDDLLCNTDTATVSLVTSYDNADWYSTNNMFVTIATGLDNVVLPEGEYVAIATDQFDACHDTVSVKIRSLSFDIPQDTTVCDSLVLEIAKEDIIVKVDGEISPSTVVIYESGTHVITVTDSENLECEEIRQINVTVHQSYYGEVTDFIAYGGDYIWNGDTLTAPGEYFYRGYTAEGCDSVVKLTLSSNSTNYTIVVEGTVVDINNNPIEGVKVSSFDNYVNTDGNGHYSIVHNIGHGLLTYSLDSYNLVSYMVRSMWDTTLNVVMDRPDMVVDDSPVVNESYPYVTREIMMEISNNGDGSLDWASVVTASDVTLESDEGQRSHNTRSLWDKYSGISTNDNAEQAVATDGYYIYTASWMREGQINKYSLNGYIGTFYVQGVGKIRNLAYGENCFFATDNTNRIYKIDMERQELIGTIELDADFQIRHCAYDKNDEVLYVGDWTSVYEVRFVNSDNPTLVPVPIASGLSNVYSTAFDGLSEGGPYLWLFSQISENNGASAKIQQLNISTGQLTGKTHYLDSLDIATSSSIAGGICATDLLYDDKFVLLANIQNSRTTNDIIVYEIARKKSWIKLDQMCGTIAPHDRATVKVTQFVTEVGSYDATITFKPSSFNASAVSVSFSSEVSAPVCESPAGFVAETDTFHVVNMSWNAVELGDYESVSYIICETSSNVAIDTVVQTNYTLADPEVGQHCYYVRTLMQGVSDCVSESSDLACIEIQEFPCEAPVALSVHAYANHMSLSWNETYGVDHYEIYRDDEILVANYVGNQYSDSTVSVETEYCYYVVAYYRNDECSPRTSTYECAKITTNVCTDIPTLSVETAGNVAIVSWTKVSDILSYSVYRDGNYITSTKDTVFVDMTLDYNTRYCYTIEISCGYGLYNMSATVCAKTGNEDAAELWSSESIELYPNPTDGMFYIEGQGIAGYTLINSIGQIVIDNEDIEEERISVDVSGLPNGLYAVKIKSSDGETVVKRVTISK